MEFMGMKNRLYGVENNTKFYHKIIITRFKQHQ